MLHRKQVVENYVCACCVHGYMHTCVCGKHTKYMPISFLSVCIHHIFSPHTYKPNVYPCDYTHICECFYDIYLWLMFLGTAKNEKKKSYEKEKNWKGTATYVFANLNITYIKKGYSMLIYVNIGKNEMYTCTSQHNTHLHKYIFFLHVLMYIYTSMFMYVCI